MERMGQANTPLGVDCIYGDRHANFIAMARAGGTMPPPWVTYSPLLPLDAYLGPTKIHLNASNERNDELHLAKLAALLRYRACDSKKPRLYEAGTNSIVLTDGVLSCHSGVCSIGGQV